MLNKNMNKKYKKRVFKTLSFFILTIMIFSNITIKSFAATSGNLDVDTSLGWSFGGTSWGQAGLMKINGKVVYCLEPLVNYVGGSVYDPSTDFNEIGISTDTAKKLSLISYFAKQRAINTGNSDWYSIASSAIWAEIGHSRGWIESPTFSNESSVKNAISQLLNDVNNYYIRPSFHNNTKTIKVGETIRLTDTNGVLNTYTIRSQDGLDARIEGNDLVVTGTENANNLSSVVLAKVIPSEDTGTSILYKSGNLQKVGAFYIEDPIRSFLEFNVQKYGNLEIGKKDNKGNFVPGTKFNLSYNSDMSNTIGTYTTGENGKVTINNLNPTTVYIQEVEVPNHLVLDGTIHNIKIEASQTVSFTATNEWKQSYIQVVKKDKKTGEVVKKAGTEFEILKNGQVISTITTNNEGIAKSGALDYSAYTVREKLAPQNYIIADITHNADLNEHGKTYEFEIFNEPVLGEIDLTKEDKETGNVAQGDGLLNNAEYVLKANKNVLNPSNGEVLYNEGEEITIKNIGNGTWGDTGTKVTNEEGKIKWSNLPMGEYSIEETKPSLGYLLDENKHIVTITSNDQTTKVVVANQKSLEQVIKGKLEIAKSGNDGAVGVINGLEGVEFTMKLYSEVQKVGWDNATTSDVLITDKSGRGTSKDLPYGVYLVKETKTPENFTKGGDFFVNIDEDKEIEYRMINNAPFKAWLKLVKTDEEGNLVTLSNATFKLKDSEGNYVKQKVALFFNKDTWKTDNNGMVALDDKVKAGTYTVEEIKTPEGFLISEPIQVEVTSTNPEIEFDQDNEPVITVKIINEKPLGKIILNKSTEIPTDIVKKGIKFKLTSATDIVNPTNGDILFKAGDIVTIDNQDGIYEVNENGNIEISNLPLGTGNVSYQLEEVLTQEGYVLLENPIIFNFEIKDNTTKEYVIEKSVENKLTETYFSKIDVAGEEIEGAELKVIDKETGDVVDEWTSTKETHVVKGLIFGRTYILHEDLAPIGFAIAQDIEFTMNENKQKFEMVDKKVTVSKVDVAGEEVEGAELKVIDKETGDVVDEWTSTKEKHQIKNLVEGKIYILHEDLAPLGFAIAQDIEFLVTEEKENQHIEMVDKKVTVSKIDVAGEEVEGAELKVIDKETGDAVDEWTSTKEKHQIENLVVGKTYILHENLAPLGFAIAQDIEFTVTEEKENQHIEMVDKRVEIIKIDSLDSRIVEGAELTIFDKETGKVVDQTISNNKSWYASNLVEGKTYILRETKVPTGYEVAEDIEFTVATDKETQKIEMKDAPILTKIQVNKVDSITKKPIKSLDFEFTLYADEECTQVLQVVKGNKENGTAIFEGLRYGTVYVKETKAPKGYKLSDEVKKIVIDDNLEGVGDTHSFVYENTLLPSITIPNTGDDSSIFTGIMSILTTLIGIGLITGRRKNVL